MTPWYHRKFVHRFTGHRRDKWDGTRYECACGYVFPIQAVPKT